MQVLEFWTKESFGRLRLRLPAGHKQLAEGERNAQRRGERRRSGAVRRRRVLPPRRRSLSQAHSPGVKYISTPQASQSSMAAVEVIT